MRRRRQRTRWVRMARWRLSSSARPRVTARVDDADPRLLDRLAETETLETVACATVNLAPDGEPEERMHKSSAVTQAFSTADPKSGGLCLCRRAEAGRSAGSHRVVWFSHRFAWPHAQVERGDRQLRL
jgi:hypothetical protein